MARSKADVVREYLAALNDPDIPTKTIAAALHRKHKSLFPTVEIARSSIRFVRGNDGHKSSRPFSKNKPFHRPPKPSGWNIPEGIEQVLPCRHFTEPGKWLLVNDLHIPFHDAKKITRVLDIGLDEGCDHFALNGDGFDFHQISKYERDLRSMNVLDELKVGQPILEQIGKRFPGRKVFNIGNHDARFDRAIMNLVPELANSDKLRLAAFLELGAMGYEVIASTQQYMIGDLPIYHGHELGFGIGNPALFANNVFRMLQSSLLVGHGHGSHEITKTLAGKRMTVTFVGHLGLRQNYRPVTDQTTGYAILNVLRDGTTVVENRRI
jgi:hypothetical protein